MNSQAMHQSYRPEPVGTRPEDAFLGAENKAAVSDGLSNAFLEGKPISREGSLEESFLRDADRARSVGDPEAFERSWEHLRPEVPSDRPVHGLDLNESFKCVTSRLSEFSDYAYAKDPTLAKMIDRIGPQMKDALAAGDLTRVGSLTADLCRGASGRFSEFVVEKTLSPYFEKVSTQRRVDGGGTVIDMLCEGARAPINLQKGNFVPQGGSLAVEIKAAKSSYFRSELEGGHLLHQVAGHRVADAGMVITTKDIKDAYRESPAILRDGARSTLREAGSPLFCFLPAKDQLDQAMKDLLKKHMS